MWFNIVQISVLNIYICLCVEHIVLVLHDFLNFRKKCSRISFMLYGIVFVYCLLALVGDN
jgi:hypothetical protein